MITQHQVRKLAKASGLEQLELIKDQIKSLEALKAKVRDELVAEGKAEYVTKWRNEYVTKGHWVTTFKPFK